MRRFAAGKESMSNPFERYVLGFKIRVAMLVTAVALVAALNEGQALATHVDCGDVVTEDTKLDSDLINCPGDGIVIGADNITIDLDDHTVDGDKKDAANDYDIGIDNGVLGRPSFDGVTVRNGVVQEFQSGIELSVGNRSLVRRLALRNNSNRGLGAGFSGDNRIEENSFSGNGSSGITLDDSHGNLVARNEVSASGRCGICVFSGDGNHIEKNLVSAIGEYGIYVVDTSAGNAVSRNVTWNNGIGIRSADARLTELLSNLVFGNGVGIQVDSGSSQNAVRSNSVRANLRAGIVLDSPRAGSQPNENRVVRNSVTRNGADGVMVLGAASGNLLSRNRTARNGDDGIDVESPHTIVTKNKANRNADLGIEAIAGVIDGGGNKARGNGIPLQCVKFRCI
jgi:parallel beta-helix repeat protein